MFSEVIKLIGYAVFIAGILWINRVFITDTDLRKWLLKSFEEDTGKTSGRSLSAFLCTVSLVTGWFISIYYSKDHTAPEYYFWGLLSLIGGLYGIKEVGRIVKTRQKKKDDNNL